MKRLSLLFLCTALLFFLPLTVKAEETPIDRLEEQTKEGLLSLLPDVAKPLLTDPTDTDALDKALGFQSLFALLTQTAGKEGCALSGRMLALIAITLLFGALTLFTGGGAVSTFMQSAAALSFFSLLF